MRVWFSLLLSLMLAVTSVPAAVMHAQMQGSSEMVICADLSQGGVTTIRLDATGQPIPQPHNCPDCLASLGSVLLPAPMLWSAPEGSQRQHFAANGQIGLGRPIPSAIARGPPVRV